MAVKSESQGERRPLRKLTAHFRGNLRILHPSKLLKQLTTAEVVRLLLRCRLPIFQQRFPRFPRAPPATFSLPATAASRQLLKSRQRHPRRRIRSRFLVSVVDVHLALVVIAPLSRSHLRQRAKTGRRVIE